MPSLLANRSAARNTRLLHEIRPTRLGDTQKEVKAIVEDQIQDTRKLQELLRKSLRDPQQQSLPMLKPLKSPCCWTWSGGRYRVRTCDPYHVKVVLYR